MTKDHIIALLKAHKVTQRELALRMGISRQALDASLNSDMRASTLERIADALNISMSELYNGHAMCRCPHCGKPIDIQLFASSTSDASEI